MFFFRTWISNLFLNFKITGRESSIYATSYVSNLRLLIPSWFTNFFFFAAYGEYYDDTIEVANARNRKLVNWILSGNCFLVRRLTFFYFNLQFFSVCSSGDSTGVIPEGQKGLNDEVVKKKPSTLLSLEHEVYGMFLFTFFSRLSTWISWLNVILVVFRNQRVNIFFLFSFFVVWYKKKDFYRHQVLPYYAIKELRNAGYKSVTVAECLGQEIHYSQVPPSTREVCV